jgi:hypothetical protein
MKLQALSLLLVFASASAFATAEPELFQIRVFTELNRLKPYVPGHSNSQRAPGSGEENVTIKLSDCRADANGDTTCGGQFKKDLILNRLKVSYFVNVWNSSKNNHHSIIMNICLTGEDVLEYCRKDLRGDVEMDGATEIPSVRIAPVDPLTHVIYQPVLGVKKVVD